MPDPDETEVEREADAAEVTSGRRRDAPSGRLLDADDFYFGRPEIGAVFAYRDAGGDVVADVQVLHTPENSKLSALVAGESMRHVDER